MTRVARGDYGYDAPYFPAICGLVSLASGIGALIFWSQGLTRPAILLMFYFVFFLANTICFLYTTRRGKFLEWERILDRFELRTCATCPSKALATAYGSRPRKCPPEDTQQECLPCLSAIQRMHVA